MTSWVIREHTHTLKSPPHLDGLVQFETSFITNFSFRYVLVHLFLAHIFVYVSDFVYTCSSVSLMGESCVCVCVRVRTQTSVEGY